MKETISFKKSQDTKSVIYTDKVAKYLFLFSGIFIIFILVLIVLFLLYQSIPFFKQQNLFEFIFGTAWNPTSMEKETYGIVPLMVSTFLTTAGSLIISIPIGLGTAVFLAEYAKGTVSETLKYIIEILSSIPSVVIGFIGIVLISPALAKITGQSHGLNALNGSILLAIMTVPTIVSISTDSIREVPKSLREASLGMGASKWETIVKVVIPTAKSGILASFMLGIGRAIGETMTVLMATGNSPAIPTSFFDSVRTMTATIAIEMGEVPFGTKHFHALFAVGLILFLISMAINVIADYMIRRRKI